MAGKSIPDEKYVSRKASAFVDGKSKLDFGFLELAYFFNYTKTGNFNPKIVEIWQTTNEKRAKNLAADSEEQAIYSFFKVQFHLFFLIFGIFFQGAVSDSIRQCC